MGSVIRVPLLTLVSDKHVFAKFHLHDILKINLFMLYYLFLFVCYFFTFGKHVNLAEDMVKIWIVIFLESPTSKGLS